MSTAADKAAKIDAADKAGGIDAADRDDGAARARAVSAAKVQIAKAGRLIGQEAVQLHGAIAKTDDYRLGHYFKRLTVIDRLFGDGDHHVRRFAGWNGI